MITTAKAIKSEALSDSDRSTSSKKLIFTDASKLVTLYGSSYPKSKPMQVHREFACYYSPVFKAAFESRFIEGITQEYRFKDSEEDVLHSLITWLYTQNLELTERAEDELHLTTREDLMLLELWVLADKLLIPQLQNLVIQKINEIYQRSQATSLESLHFVWNNTSKGSPLRRYIVFQVSDINPDSYLNDLNQYPKEMLAEMLYFLRKEDLDTRSDFQIHDYMVSEL